MHQAASRDPQRSLDVPGLVARAVAKSSLNRVAAVTGVSRSGVASIIARRAAKGSIALAAQHVDELEALAGDASARGEQVVLCKD